MDLVFKIFVYSWLISIFFGIIVAISYPLFIDDADNRYEVFIPLYNLFGVCSSNGYSEIFGLLFLIPGINILFMMFMAYKLKDKYPVSKVFSICLLLLPIIFMPILAHSKKLQGGSESYTYEANEEVNQTQTYIAPPVVERVKEENKKSRKEKEKEVEENIDDDTEIFDENALSDDDSIFKLQPKTKEVVNNKPYKARKVRVNEQFINSAPAEREKIEKVEKGDN